MTPGLPRASVAAALAREWGVTADALEPNHGGMNSQTWFVDADARRFVAKAVPIERRDSFEAGLAIATIVEATGIRAGAPVPARDGRLCINLDDNVLALLSFVAGGELTGDSVEERRLIGATLGRVHLALAGHEIPAASRFHRIDPSVPHLDLRAVGATGHKSGHRGLGRDPARLAHLGPAAHRPRAGGLPPGPEDR